MEENITKALRKERSGQKALTDVPPSRELWDKNKIDFFNEVGTIPEELMGTGGLQASQLGLAVDFDLVNQRVLETVGAYKNVWWNELSTKTQDNLRTAIATNIETGGRHRDLVKSLEGTFGKVRAEMIASTETTRLYTEGNRTAYAMSGIEQVEFQTVNDSAVDPKCDELNGRVFGLNAEEAVPPIHVRCRCWLAPITEEGQVLNNKQPPPTSELSSSLVDSGEEYYQKWVTGDFSGADKMRAAWRKSGGREAKTLGRILKNRYVGDRAKATEFRKAASAVLNNDSLALAAMNPSLQKDARFLVNLMQTSPIQNTTVYRGMNFSNPRLLEEFLSQHKVGSTVDLSLGSSTYDKAHSTLFWGSEGNVRYEVLGHRGTPISLASPSPWESEVILSGRFKIEKIVEIGETTEELSHWKIVLRQTSTFDPV